MSLSNNSTEKLLAILFPIGILIINIPVQMRLIKKDSLLKPIKKLEEMKNYLFGMMEVMVISFIN